MINLIVLWDVTTATMKEKKEEKHTLPDEENRLNLMPYPTSTLSPQIIPNDLTSFKSRGSTAVEKELRQQMKEMKEKYDSIIDSFNWNKLVYESEFGFEPVMGQIYHLYQIEGSVRRLSMVPPEDWKQYRWIGSFRLNVDRRWEEIETSEDFDLRDIAGNE